MTSSGQSHIIAEHHQNCNRKPGLTRHPGRMFSSWLAFIILMVMAAPAWSAEGENTGIKVFCNGVYAGSTAYIDPSSGAAMVPLALIQGIPGLRFDIRDNEAWFLLNGRRLQTRLNSLQYTLDGKAGSFRSAINPWQYGIAVPGRDLCEALGGQVEWDENNRAIHIKTPLQTPPVPHNSADEALPVRLAFIHEGQLYLLNATQTGEDPLVIPSQNVEQIVGWSHDGQWLAYVQRPGDDRYCGEEYLWVVSADGRQNQCLDNSPLACYYGTPAWSPADNTIAYETESRNQTDDVQINLKVAGQKNGCWESRNLLAASGRNLSSSPAWFPDGQSLAVSFQRDANNLPEVKRIDLQGGSASLFILPQDLAGNVQDGLYTADISGLKLSPDGRYLACYLGMNSASLNSDGRGLILIDLQNSRTPVELGCGLGYPDWLAWSADSRQLAFILGGNRTASVNKHLHLVQIDQGGFHEQDLKKEGMADSRPFWSTDGSVLYYARGKESAAWMEEGRHQEVQVPGQQIYCQSGGEVALTTPGELQADYPLAISPDGRYLAFQRQDYVDLASLYLLNLKNRQLIKVMDNVQTSAGYYGNYYPDSIKIFWTNN